MAVARKDVALNRADIQPLVDGWVKGRNLPNVPNDIVVSVRPKLEALAMRLKDRKINVFESTGGQVDEVDLVDHIIEDLPSYLPPLDV